MCKRKKKKELYVSFLSLWGVVSLSIISYFLFIFDTTTSLQVTFFSSMVCKRHIVKTVITLYGDL